MKKLIRKLVILNLAIVGLHSTTVNAMLKNCLPKACFSKASQPLSDSLTYGLIEDRVPDEPWGGECGVTPNESSPNQFRDSLQNHLKTQGPGALISVGTFRSLVDAGMGFFDGTMHFTFIFLLDYNKEFTEFNRVHLELLKTLGNLPISTERQRLEYMTFLRCEKNYSSTLKPLKRFYKFFCEIHGKNGTLGSALDSLDGANEYYWSNNEQWQAIQELIKSERILAVTGDLFGQKTLESIGRLLEENEESLRILDVSNSLEYFNSSEGYDRNKLEKLKSNLEKIPGNEQTLMLRTSLEETDASYHLEAYPWIYSSKLAFQSIEELLSGNIHELNSEDSQN